MDELNIDELAKKISSNLTSAKIYDDSELDGYIQKSQIGISDNFEKPKTIMSMVEDNHVHKEQLTNQNISTTIGGAKSKKTFFTVMLVSSILGCNNFSMSGNTYDKKILWIDTEQSNYHVHRILRRLKKLGIDLNMVDMFGLRPYMPELRFSILERILSTKNYYSFVVIDGVVDLLYDFNDLKESKKLVTKIMEWSSIYDCHINTILHTNKDLHNARGHIGTELMNKSETVFRITKEDDGNSIVEGEYTRNEGFKKWVFHIENGIPVRNDFPTGYFHDPIVKENSYIVNSKFDEVPF